jgi:hypothetical protein
MPAYVRLHDPFSCRGTRERKRPIIDKTVRRHPRSLPRNPNDAEPARVRLLQLSGSGAGEPRLLPAERRLSQRVQRSELETSAIVD